jgi:flagellar biogenesis protein FliO
MEWVLQIVAAAVVLGLLGTILWWLQRRGLAAIAPMRRSTGRRMETLERLPLGPQHTLHLIRVGEKTLLIACSPAGCAVLESSSSREMSLRQEAMG